MWYTLEIEVFKKCIKTDRVTPYKYPREIKGAKAARAKADQIRAAIADVCESNCCIIRRDRTGRGTLLAANRGDQ